MDTSPEPADYDLIVIGGGPAGSAAALSALQEDPSARVALVDRAKFPRDKVCGDALGPDALAELVSLDAASVLEGYSPVSKVALTAGNHQVARRSPVPGYVVPRQVFDGRLVDLAVQRGAHLVHARVREVKRRPDGLVDVVGVGTASVVVGADGANSTVRRNLGVDRVPASHEVVGLRAYTSAAPQHGDPLEIKWVGEQLGRAYVWRFPTNGTCNVGVGVMRDRLTGGRAQLEDLMRRHLGDVNLVEGSVRGGNLPLASHRPVLGAGRVLLAGDAAGLINPLSGEGIYYALMSGRRAAAAALDSDAVPPLAAYQQGLRRLLGRHLAHVRMLARAADLDWPVRRAVATAVRSAEAFEAMIDLALGTGTLTPGLVHRVVRGH